MTYSSVMDITNNPDFYPPGVWPLIQQRRQLEAFYNGTVAAFAKTNRIKLAETPNPVHTMLEEDETKSNDWLDCVEPHLPLPVYHGLPIGLLPMSEPEPQVSLVNSRHSEGWTPEFETYAECLKWLEPLEPDETRMLTPSPKTRSPTPAVQVSSSPMVVVPSYELAAIKRSEYVDMTKARSGSKKGGKEGVDKSKRYNLRTRGKGWK